VQIFEHIHIELAENNFLLKCLNLKIGILLTNHQALNHGITYVNIISATIQIVINKIDKKYSI